MNRQEFVAEMLSALGGRDATDETMQLTVAGSSYSLPHAWLNRAERRIAARHQFRVLDELNRSLSTVADDATAIDLPTYTKSVNSVRIIDGTSSYEVTYKSPMWFDLNCPYPAGEAPGKPGIYTIKPSLGATNVKAVYFYPIPDAIYSLYIDRTKWPAPMSGDTSVSEFGDEFLDHVILEYALMFGYLHRGEAYKKDAAYHSTMGDKFLDEMIGADDYVPALRVTSEGYEPTYKKGFTTSIDAGAFPSGVVSPWRR